MAKRNKDELKDSDSFIKGVREETLRGILAIVFFVGGILFILSAAGKSGVLGMLAYEWLSLLLGFGYFLLPVVFFIVGFSFWKNIRRNFPLTKVFASFLFFLAGLGLIYLVDENNGGILGGIIGRPLLRLLDIYGSVLFLGALFVISLLIIFETTIKADPLIYLWRKFFRRKEKDLGVAEEKEEDSFETAEEDVPEDKEDAGQPLPPKEEKREKIKTPPALEEEFFPKSADPDRFRGIVRTYSPPPLSLLERDKGKPEVGDIKARMNVIRRTLQNFGINVEMDEVSIGPSVTRYALKPAEGVKLSKIVALQNDLSLALAAHPLRIEAPIPGKSLVGIEIPNNTKSTVGLATMLGSEEFQTSPKSLLLSLGKSITGKCHFANLAKMPHLLISGTTGSGKSVIIHTIITSLIFRNSPENLKFIMIDPKRVELTLYNRIPHLLTPVITEAKKAILALKWAAKEMDRRYDILESEAVRDIESYHKNVLEPELKKLKNKEGDEISPDESVKLPEMMPYIVIVIDELADIMSTYPRELESAIVRLAQMSRAVGIHLILSTQRPSVNVITGLIKANVPARIALQVSSQIDSRTILDTGGAEKLLGAGDMLYLGAETSKPQRIQSAYISESEVKKVVKHLIQEHGDDIPSEINLTSEAVADKNAIFESSFEEQGEEIDDDLYEQAREEVIKAGKASTSYIQRKLRVGYARAARLMDILEERGIIGPADGAKPREVMGGTPSNSSSSASPETEEENAETLNNL